MGKKRIHKMNGTVNVSAIAGGLGVKHATAKRWLGQGMPSTSLRAARAWQKANRPKPEQTLWKAKVAAELGITYHVVSYHIRNHKAPGSAEGFRLWWQFEQLRRRDRSQARQEANRLKANLRYWQNREVARECQRLYEATARAKAMRRERQRQRRAALATSAEHPGLKQ